LPMRDATLWSPEVLEGLERCALVCVDDVDAIAGLSIWEEALFHLYNRITEQGHCLVLSACAAPAELKLQLPDLASRLAWGLVLHLEALAENDKLVALQLRAQQRGFELPNDVAQFLLRRCPRDTPSLFALLDRLDEASLAAQRKLTIPFVRKLI
ncbi:MAG: DnaA regulatory inactivator Hda, partial [Gammaproteobacteria bacterium]|nr:DnaA regulatory inactivator Hda [Gammaproteobacteria bacterium]